MRLYLDTCSLHRPLDDRTQPRVALEAEAVSAILAACESGDATLIVSEALRIEAERSPQQQRKAFASEVIADASTFVPLTDDIRRRAEN